MVSAGSHTEHFHTHRDSIDPRSHRRDHLQYGRLPYANGIYSNRVITMLMYLNEVQAGGATVFPLLNIDVQPEAGACLVFFPLHGMHPHTRHTNIALCQKVIVGQKRVYQQWICSSPYEPEKDTGSKDIQHGLQWIYKHPRPYRKERLSRKQKCNTHKSKSLKRSPKPLKPL